MDGREGSRKGHNARKHAVPFQSSSLAGGFDGGSLPTPRLVAQRQLRTSTRSSGSFSKKHWRCGRSAKPSVVRADAGFFDDELLSFLEERRLP